VSEDVEPQSAAGVVDRVESGIADQLGDDRLGFLISGQEHDPSLPLVPAARRRAGGERDVVAGGVPEPA
jgi:hypothetical protein